MIKTKEHIVKKPTHPTTSKACGIKSELVALPFTTLIRRTREEYELFTYQSN